MNNYENEIREHIVSTRNIGNFSLQDCTLEISQTGDAEVKGVNNLIGFAIIVDGKCIDIAKGNKYKLIVPPSQSVSVYVVAVDENAVLYKSNTVSYTLNIMYIYHEGNEFTDITSGWRFTNQTYSSKGTDRDCLHAIRTGGAFGGWLFSSQESFDVTNYRYLCCEYSISGDEGYDGRGSRLILNNQPDDLSWTGAAVSDSFIYNKENEILKWDISSIEGEYFVGVTSGGARDTYIYSIWFE